MVIHHGDRSVFRYPRDFLHIDKTGKTAEEVRTACDDDCEKCRYDRTRRNCLFTLDRVELLDHLRQSPCSEGCQNDDIHESHRIRAEEGRKRTLLPCRDRIVAWNRGKRLHCFEEAAVSVQNGENNCHDTDQHDNTLDEIVVDCRRVSAKQDVDACECCHHDDTVDIRDTECHLKKIRETVVDRSRIRNQEYEDDRGSHDLKRR